MRLLFQKPARDFFEALPIGNGRLGAMISGDIVRESIILNESSMWSGSPEDADRQDAVEYLGQIREDLKNGKNYEAQQLFAKHFTCKGPGSNCGCGARVPFGCYQILGRLHLSYLHAVSSGRPNSSEYHDYQRELDLDTGIASVSFEAGGWHCKREYFVSPIDQAVIIHLTCQEEGQINVSCGLDRDEGFVLQKSSEGTSLVMKGQLEDGKEENTGVCFAAALGAKAIGGRIEVEEQRVIVREAQEAWIFVTARTDLSGFLGREKVDPVAMALEDLEKVRHRSYEEIWEDFQQWYQSQYGSMTIELGDVDAEKENLPTKERIERFLAGEEDTGLTALYVQYARYLLLCSSQENGLPANLQGIWAEEIQTPWNGDWHLNAQQMIYWLAEKGNLSSCHLPYLKLTKELAKHGEKTAKAYYGARGWLVHTFTNPWGFTAPGEEASWGSTTGSPAWQCHHLWEHYLYTGDKEYLKEVYPVMKGAALFYMDMLVENKDGFLVTSPSSSPENAFLDQEGRVCSLCEGPAYDRELLKALFQYCLQAQYILKEDLEFVKEVKEVLGKLAPVEIASDGRIMEWDKEYPEEYPYHRHVSHLWGLYPGNDISLEKTPELARAAQNSLEKRGRTTAGWAISFRVCLWARLRQGENAYSCFQDAIRYATAYNMLNLAFHSVEKTQELPEVDVEKNHYPFQIDGNQGNATGVLMLFEDDEARVLEDGSWEIDIYLLPALPEEYSQKGKIRGLQAKGNLEVSFAWENGIVTEAVIKGESGVRFNLHCNNTVQNICLKDGIYQFSQG